MPASGRAPPRPFPPHAVRDCTDCAVFVVELPEDVLEKVVKVRLELHLAEGGTGAAVGEHWLVGRVLVEVLDENCLAVGRAVVQPRAAVAVAARANLVEERAVDPAGRGGGHSWGARGTRRREGEGGREREGGRREREREGGRREREREREGGRGRGRARARERARERERERERDRESEREREMERERALDSERTRERWRESARARERERAKAR